MAIYNPKRARELEAAARLAESQRQRELAKGQREQRTTEQILGLVEGLIGAAPQVVGGLQDVQAQQVLAGEKPLPEQKPETDNILENIGRFITDPFEAGVRQKARTMAAERAPAELAALRPLAASAVKTTPLDKPEERKEISKEQFEERLKAASPEFAGERVQTMLEESPVLQLLPEQQRRAMAAGEVQRVRAEQAAAEREAELFGLQKRKIEAEAGAKEAQAKKLLTEAESKKQQVAPAKMKELGKALAADLRSFAQDLTQDLNSTDPKIRAEAIDRLNQRALEEARTIKNSDGSPISQDSPVARAARGEAVAQLMKELDLPPLNQAAQDSLVQDRSTIENIANMIEKRKKVGFSLEQEEVIGRALLDGSGNFLGVPSVLKALQDAGLKATLTAEQLSWLNSAMIVKVRLTTQEFKGTGAISDRERAAVMPYVLNPFSTEAQFDQQARDTIRDIADKFVLKVNSYKKLNKFDDELIKFAENLNSAIPSKDYGEIYKLLSEPSPGAKDVMYGKGEEGAALTGGAAKILEPVSKSIFELTDYFQSLVSSSDPETAATASAALEGLKKILPQQQPAAAPQTSQQQVQQMQPVQEAEETAYARLKQEGKLGPGLEMFIITNQQGKVSYVTAEDTEEGIRKLESAVSKKAPGSTIQKYTGNLAGGK